MGNLGHPCEHGLCCMVCTKEYDTRIVDLEQQLQAEKDAHWKTRTEWLESLNEARNKYRDEVGAHVQARATIKTLTEALEAARWNLGPPDFVPPRELGEWIKKHNEGIDKALHGKGGNGEA